MQGSPFNSSPKQTLNKNYSEVFDPAEYECKDTQDLESYRRNLHNMLMDYLKQTPFPAYLFDKLSKREEGIASILEKRYAASGVLNKEQAKKKLADLEARMNAVGTMQDENPVPLKKRKLDPPYVEEVRTSMQQIRDLRSSGPNFIINDTTEEEEED